MKSILKLKKVIVDPFGELTLRELHAKAQIELFEAIGKEEGPRSAFLACKYGVVEWETEDLDSLMTAMNISTANGIAKMVYELSGLGETAEKN